MITYNEKSELYIHEDKAWPMFKEIVAGIGWADPSNADTGTQNWCVIVGHAENGNYYILAEFFGDMPRLLEWITNEKDRLLIQRIFTDRTRTHLLRMVSDADGLVASYKSSGKDFAGREQYHNSPDKWPYFRDRNTHARLIPLPEEATADRQSGVEVIRKLKAMDRIAVRPGCPQIQKLVQSFRLDEAIDHPGIQALWYCLWVLDNEQRRSSSQQKSKTQPIYGNLRR